MELMNGKVSDITGITGNDQASKLRIEAIRSSVFNAVMTAWALRERARQEVTLRNLSITMHKQGFSFTKEQLGGVLGFLAGIGIGRLHRDSKNRLYALKDIKVTLQSVGLAAVQGDSLENFRPVKRFGKVSAIGTSTSGSPKASITSKAVKVTESSQSDKVLLTVLLSSDGQLRFSVAKA